jgi:uncharacterized protein (TIGR00251 family)
VNTERIDPASCVRATSDGVLLDVEATPAAADLAFPSGFNPWRRRLEARLTEPAHDGAANAQLLQAAAAFFHVPADHVEVTTGATSRRKTLKVTGIDLDAARQRVRNALA